MENNHNEKPALILSPVSPGNWRKVIRVKVHEYQQDYVADPSYYLLLCHYGELWQPLAIFVGEQVIGFIMWGIDPQDGSCWLGGFQIDAEWQGQGYGRQAMLQAMEILSVEQNTRHFALSVQPENPAKQFYESLGFVETEDWEEDEVVMRILLEK